jgi:cyclopropane-fatty-acyl-phospholipid synthase
MTLVEYKFKNFQHKTLSIVKEGYFQYNLGNDIYRAMLDKNMQYTCGYWKSAKNLEEAQLAKMELIAQKLKLEPGMTVLDIGCGFGTLAYYLASKHRVKVVGCSISKEQTKFGQDLCANLPSVEFKLCDYRDLEGQYDRIVSVGMFEHVGRYNYKEFFGVVHKCLKPDGIFLLHTIGNNSPWMATVSLWIHKYIFPNGSIPYPKEICEASEDQWIIEDWHNFGLDYSKTLKAWDENFEKAWPTLQAKYGDRFYRMWKLYLSLSQAVFLTRSWQLWQIVFTKEGLPNGYHAPR